MAILTRVKDHIDMTLNLPSPLAAMQVPKQTNNSICHTFISWYVSSLDIRFT